MKKLVSLPSLLALGLLFGRAHADDGRAIAGFWPAASDVGASGAAKAHAPTPPTPATPATPATPVPPPPPPPPHVPGIGNGINISIHDGKVSIDGVDKFVDEQINNAMKGIDNPGVPPEIQKKLHERLEKLRTKLKTKLAHIDASNLDQLGDELGEVGDEIGNEMDQFGADMNAWGDKFGKDFAKDFAKQWKDKGGVHVNVDSDDDNDIPEPPDMDDDGDLDDAVRDLGDLKLSPDQRAKISAIRAETDAKVADAKHKLDAASDKLKKLLSDEGAKEADVSAAIDGVTAQENAIRKARLLAWVKARNELQKDQRAKVEKAAAKKSK